MATPRRRHLLWAGLAGLALLLAGMAYLSIVVGARPITLSAIWQALTAYDPTITDHTIIRELRLPRTLVGLMVGAALGLSGAILQGATRNPLADPSLLGINSGASLGVVIGVAVFGLQTLSAYVWLAFAGAGLAMALVYAVASFGREGATPVKLALAGAATTAALISVITAFLLTSTRTLQEIRFWQVGALAGRSLDIVAQVLPFILVGVVLALLIGRMLDGLSLGEDVARALGQNVRRSRLLAIGTAVLLAGAATAAAGPIAFVGLTMPHAARALTGPNYRWILPYSMLMAPTLLLLADIVGRVVTPPGELQVGIVTAFIGAPFFIALVRRRKLAEL